MEEEIITPEEEVFDYQKLRYILDKDGYVCHASLGSLIVCDLGECTEYKGEIPSDYETIEEWYEEENERLNAWKLVDGNLVFDTSKYAELQEKCEQEEIDNSYVTHKEIFELQKEIEDIQDVNNSQYIKANASGKIIAIDNVKKVYPKIKITNIDCYLFNKVDLILNGKNILPNTATSQTIDGVTFTQNEDRSITINGTSTENIEYNIAGTSNNASPFLCLKKGFDYYSSSNNYQIKMYNYDGVDRTQIYSGTGGIINFTDNDKTVTQIVLCIPKGTTIKNVTVYPQLEVGSTGTDYEEYKLGTITVDFSEYIGEEPLYPSDLNIKHSALKTGTTKSGVSKALNNAVETSEALYPGDDLYPSGTSIDHIYIEEGKVYVSVNGTQTYLMKANVNLFDGFNTVYTMQDTKIEMTYCINLLDVDNLEFLQGKATTTNKFKILKDGSIEAHNGFFSGTISGSQFKGNSEESIKVEIGYNSTDKTLLSDNAFRVLRSDETKILDVYGKYWNTEGLRSCQFLTDADNFTFYSNGGDVAATLYAGSYNQASLESIKKNFEKFDGGLELIKNSDIYKYHLKIQKDEDRKHIGLVINDLGGEYKTPDEVVNQNGIDLYSMISVAWQSIKELNNKVEELETKIKEMEENQYGENTI